MGTGTQGQVLGKCHLKSLGLFVDDERTGLKAGTQASIRRGGKKWPNKRRACPVEPVQRGRWPNKRKASRNWPSREEGFGGGQALSSA
eukprot:291997-Pleurochrysis_carterae.AAC.1